MPIESKHAAAMKRLVRRAQRGDAAAFETLARSCTNSLYRVAASCLRGDEADVADALQNTLLAAWSHINDLENPHYFKTWIIRICINACRQIQRSRRSDVPFETLGEGKADASLRAAGHIDETTRMAAEAEANAAFHRLVAAAGESNALAITLYYGEGMSTSEIADLLDLTPENVRQRLFRGRKRIAKTLRENGYPAPFEDDATAKKTDRITRLRSPDIDDATLVHAVNPA